MASTPTIPTKRLPDGSVMPVLGFGTGSLWFKEDYSPSFDEQTVAAVKQAISTDFIHLDTAEKYRTEAEVGAGIKQSGVDRADLWVTTKVLASIDDIPKALDASLARLGLDYVDMFLIHEPFWATSKQQLQQAWAAMEAVKLTGKARGIGVSNFGCEHLAAVLETARERPAIDQIEYNPYNQDTALLQYLRDHDIAAAAYAPLTPLKVAPGPIDQLVSELAAKYRVSSAAILLRWCFDQDLIVISTSAKERELRDYLQAFTFALTPEEVQQVASLGSQRFSRSFYGEFYHGDTHRLLKALDE